MLGTRTKQVFSYGRRGQRIVNISDDHENSISTKDRDPYRTPVLVKTKMRQHFPSESPSPRSVVRIRTAKKKRLPPSLSPTSLKKKRTRVRQLIESDVASKSKPNDARLPLSPYHPNVPLSPSVGVKLRARVPGAKGTPLVTKPTKPFSLFVDVDIIMLDEKGTRISQERRVSKTDVVVNPLKIRGTSGQPRKSSMKAKKTDVIVLSGSEDDIAPKPPKRSGRAKAVVVSSDESTDAEEPAPRAPKPPAEPVPRAKPTQRLQVEVVVPRVRHIAKAKMRSPVPGLLPMPLRPAAPKYVPFPQAQPARARQLTPIRQGSSKLLFRAPSPSSPTTPSSLDISLDIDFSNLTLTPSHTIQSIPPPEYLLPLLDECAQATPHEFSAFIETFPFDQIVQPIDENFDSLDDVQFRKIGEASYSEVFGIGNVVLKVIPLRDDHSVSAPAPTSEMETPFPSEAKDVLKEIIVTHAMGEVCDGFVKLLRTYIVRGRYPELLLTLWDEYNNKKGSEGIRPDGFHVSQVYAIIVLPNGGPDLEAYTFAQPIKHGWRQACSLFWQVARTLARAEELVQFEHRDLHWGQILVRNTTTGTSTAKSSSRRKTLMDDLSHGVEATIIDLGLARMDGGDGVHWTPFDDEIFEGKGDYQFDVYRMMREDVGEEYRPVTNVMWLHYLALKLLHAKRLKAPGVSQAKPTALSSGYTERECYEALVEVEAVLGMCIKDLKKRKKAKKTVGAAGKVGPMALRSAADVVKFGAGKGWVQ